MALPTPRRISELDVAGPLTGAEQMPIDQNNRTVKATIQTVKAFTDTSCQCTLVSRWNASTTTGATPDYLYTYTMPGNTMVSNGSWIELIAHGNFANNANTKAIGFEIGGNTFTFGPDDYNQNTEWIIRAIVTRTTTQDFNVYTEIVTNSTGGSVLTPYSASYSTTGTLVDTFLDDVVIQLTSTANAGDATANAFIIRNNKLDADS